jgi:hypothetical protein
MIIGFTGTQKGMTAKQAMSLGLLIIKLKPLEFHHGDCIGADEQAHREVRLHSPKTEIVGHPPLIQNKRAFCKFDREWHPADYLVRNREIVQCSSRLTQQAQIHEPSHLWCGGLGHWTTLWLGSKIKYPSVQVR